MTHGGSPDDRQTALRLIRELFQPTRLVRSDALSNRVGWDAYLKLECELPTGSFKVRGAFYALSSRLQRERVGEVVAASTGNHGAAVAWAAQQLGVAARVFVPVGANVVKAERIRSLGAVLSETGADIEGSRRAAEAHANATGAMLLDDATSCDVPIGAGTIGLELLEQLPGCGTVVVPVGDSALIRGIASAMKPANPNVRVVGVQASNAPAYYRSWHAGQVMTTATANTIADGLATTTPTESNVAAMLTLVDDMVLVTEDDMLEAMRWLIDTERLAVEPAAAAPVAALLHPTRPHAGPIVAIISGSNIAPELQSRVDFFESA